MTRRRLHSSPEVGLDGFVPERSYGDVNWQISAMGGYMLKFSHDGADLLFQDQQLQGKRRGGNFAALPQFGPDDRMVKRPLAQHGFGRGTLWTVNRIADQSAHLQLLRGTGEYSGLDTSLVYRINRGVNAGISLYAKLELHNDTDKELRIAPAFHPYIDISRLGQEDIAETQNGLEAAHTVPASEAVIKVAPDQEVVVQTNGFEKLTWWTDGLGPYICIEPSLAGPSFSTRPTTPTDTEILEPGDIRTFEMLLTWRYIGNKVLLKNKPRLQ